MSILVADCPRCGAKSMTFDVRQDLLVGWQYQWQRWYEVFGVCRNCRRSTTFVCSQRNIAHGDVLESLESLSKFGGSVNDFVEVERFLSLRDQAGQTPPDHVPEEIKAAFVEGATCLTVECWNAAGTMFRLCVDLATRPLLPKAEVPGLNAKTRRDLGLRLPWLFANGQLPLGLRDLSSCIREDGNDGAHAGTLKKEDAEDLLDFTWALLERLYTEPEKLRLANKRREVRRQAR